MHDEPNPRQDALDGLNAERFAPPATQPAMSDAVEVGTGPSASLVARARANNARRRASVLAHDDLARLTQPPLSYSDPHQWSGYVPPELYDGMHNDSERRRALVEIMREVNARELAAAASQSVDRAVDEPDPLYDFDPPEPEDE